MFRENVVDFNEDFSADITIDDGRWNDEVFLTKQAELSAQQDAIEKGINVG